MFEIQQLRRAYGNVDPELPRLRMNFISSLDGAATVGGLSAGLNDPWDLQLFETLRSLADVVLVAAGTLRQEGYDAVFLPEEHSAWRRDQGKADHPRLAIVTASGELDPSSAPFELDSRKERPLVFVGRAAAPEKVERLRGVAEVVTCPGDSDQVDLVQVVAELAERGLNQILCEGGPTLFGALLAADLVDELCLTLSPLLVGGPAGRIATSAGEHMRNMGLIDSFSGGAMMFLRYGRTLGPRESSESPQDL